MSSTLSTLSELDVSVKSKVISLLDGFAVCNMSSSLAHMFPSSPVSVGILASNRTLEVGALHLAIPAILRVVVLKQFPVADGPFTDTISAVGKK